MYRYHCQCRTRIKNKAYMRKKSRKKEFQQFSYLIHYRPPTRQPLYPLFFNTLGSRQNGRLFSDDIFTCIFLNGKVWISINISLKFVPEGQNNNIPALVLIMAWRRPGNKPLSEPMMVRSLTHICVTRPQWVKRTPQDLSKWHYVTLTGWVVIWGLMSLDAVLCPDKITK